MNCKDNLRYNDGVRRRETDGKSDDFECSPVNPMVKARAEEVLSKLGVPMSTAINMYLNQISLTGDSVRCYAAASAERDEHG